MHLNTTAIIVSYNSAHALPACLAALAREGVAALVVDNASTDNSAGVAAALGARVIINMHNLGFGTAMNVGVREATSEFCLLLNPDAIVEQDAIDALLQAASAYPDAAIIAPQLVEADGRVFFQPRSYLAPFLENPNATLRLPEGESCVPFVSGACMLVRRELFSKLGGFDEKIFLFYEDDDICRRICDAGLSIIYTPHAVVQHGRGKSSTTTNHYVIRYHQAWSKCYVAKKYGLASPAPSLIGWQLGKWLVAMLTCNRRKIRRHAGSVMGAWDFIRGTHR
jgi:N-acetylglucosaminyl-diphospho-decaprenol L-rhamnosyltransferase